jgi:hypothetical protein
MPVAENTGGSQTAVISTEHTLATITTAGTYILWVNTTNMVKGDRLTLRAKVKMRSGSTSTLAYIGRFANAQGVPAKVSIPVDTPFEVVFTLQQTAGTGRSFEWSVHSL